ncbi:MAG: glycosyltransferase [Chloroflexi bacterium]|nr:glycosyltransferase [Chloroflexota bacterium]
MLARTSPVLFVATPIGFNCPALSYETGTEKDLLVGFRSGSVGELPSRILQVSTSDIGGGAEKIAWDLLHNYRLRCCTAWLAVGYKRSDDPDVFLIPNDAAAERWSRFWRDAERHLRSMDRQMKGVRPLCDVVHSLAAPSRWIDVRRGVEDFHFPGTRHLLKLTPQPPDIVHCHNLHDGYFDLRVLPWLSHRVPMVLTLHDAWLFSGHCAHSFDCERWRKGCGHCPDLTIYPAIRRDNTAHNWRKKSGLYARSQLFVATPSQWLMRKVEQSILVPAVVEAKVIPNGVDLSIFCPGVKEAVRTALDIPQSTKVLLFAANGIRGNIWKDYLTMQDAVARVAGRLQGQSILFLALGEDAPIERIGRAEIRFVPFQKDPRMVARYYQAADVYVHAAKVDTFPNTVLEALACGTPVLATAVGGVPEQVKGFKAFDWRSLDLSLNRFEQGEATGVLVPLGDAEAMGIAIEQLMNDESLRRNLGANAALDAEKRFDLNRQAEEYLAWYQEIVRRRNCAPSTFPRSD